MAYTFGEITYALIELAIATPAMKVERKPRKKVLEIKMKNHGRYITGQEVFNHLKFLYETTNKQTVEWKYLRYTVKDKHVEFSL